MTIQEFARLLDDREYGNEITKQEKQQAKELGYVVVFGASDDLMELRGAIDDEFGCCDGGIAFIDADGLIEECDCACQYYEKALNKAQTIKAIWCGDDSDFTWTYKTSLPHETFEIFEDGEKYCRGIVFDIKTLGVES